MTCSPCTSGAHELCHSRAGGKIAEIFDATPFAPAQPCSCVTCRIAVNNYILLNLKPGAAS